MFSTMRNLFGILLILSLAACSRTQVIPEESPPGTPPEIVPPVSMPGDGSAPPAGMPSAGGTVMHTVQAGEGLYGIARQYGVNFRDIAAWNNIPPPYTLHPGQSLVVSPPGGGMAMPGQPSAPAAQYHTVQRGETLYSIGRSYGLNFREIAAWNNVNPPYNLSVGQRLLVSPSAGGAITTPANQPPQPTIVNFDPNTPLYAPVPAAPPAPAYSGGTARHTVQRGETLYSISKRYGHHYRDVAAWNGIAPPYSLRVGQVLNVGGSSGAGIPVASPQPVSGSAYYTVQRGDTLYSISRRQGVSVSQLASMNSLRAPYTLRVGQRLRVSSSGAGMATASVAPAAVFSAPAAMPAATSKPRYTAISTSKTYHTVKAGESLASIAARYGQNMQELALWNGLAPPYILTPGKTLMVIQ